MRQFAWNLFAAYLIATLICSDAALGALNIDPEAVHFMHVCKKAVFIAHVIAELLHRYGLRTVALLRRAGKAVKRWWVIGLSS